MVDGKCGRLGNYGSSGADVDDGMFGKIRESSYLCKRKPQDNGLPRKRISLFRERELGHFTKVQSRNKDIIYLDCIRHIATYAKWSLDETLSTLYHKRESKPYVRDGETDWLHFLCCNKCSQCRRASDMQKVAPDTYLGISL